ARLHQPGGAAPRPRGSEMVSTRRRGDDLQRATPSTRWMASMTRSEVGSTERGVPVLFSSPGTRRWGMADESDVISEGYVFRRGEVEEERRLEAQARVIDPLTERLFRSVGLERGMRVLELGSGAGDVSMLAARIVGTQGSVLGLDSSGEALATAR